MVAPFFQCLILRHFFIEVNPFFDLICTTGIARAILTKISPSIIVPIPRRVVRPVVALASETIAKSVVALAPSVAVAAASKEVEKESSAASGRFGGLEWSATGSLFGDGGV